MISMQGLGYKEIIPYIQGEMTLEEAIYILKRDTRHYAKKQLTWFRREKDINWVNKDDFPNTSTLLTYLKKELIKREVLT